MRREKIDHYVFDGGGLGDGRLTTDGRHTRGCVSVGGVVTMTVDTYVFPVSGDNCATLHVYALSPEFLGLLREPLYRFARAEGHLGGGFIGGHPVCPGMGTAITEETGFAIHTPNVFTTREGHKFTAEVVYLGCLGSRRLMGWKYIADWDYLTFNKEAYAMAESTHNALMRAFTNFCEAYVRALTELSSRKEVVEVHTLPNMKDWRTASDMRSEFVTDPARVAELFAGAAVAPAPSGRGMLIDP